MPSLIDSLGLGISGPGRGAVDPQAFLPVGTVAKSIGGGNVASPPQASAPSPGPQGAPSAATSAQNLQTLIAGDDPDAEAGRFGMDPTTKDSMLLGLAAGLQSGGLEGGAAGALMGFARASAVKRGRPARAAAAETAAADKALETEKTRSEIQENLPDFAQVRDEAKRRHPDDPAAQAAFEKSSSDFRRAGAVKSEVTVGAEENAFNKELGKGLAKANLDTRSAVFAAEDEAFDRQDLVAQLRVANENAVTGGFFDTRGVIRDTAGLLGIELPEEFFGDKVSARVFEQARNQFSLKAAQSMKGNLNAREFSVLENAFVNAGASTAANEVMIDAIDLVNVRDLGVAQLLSQYEEIAGEGNLTGRGVRLPSGDKLPPWTTVKREWLAKNPAFDDEFQARLTGVGDIAETPEFVEQGLDTGAPTEELTEEQWNALSPEEQRVRMSALGGQ